MGLIPENIIDELRESTPIDQVISEYVSLKKAGSNFMGLCPFHEEKTPSFSVNPRLGIFKCFGCGEGGNVFKFLMSHEKMNFIESVQFLARKQGIDVSRFLDSNKNENDTRGRDRIIQINNLALNFFQEALKHKIGSKARDYLQSRTINKNSQEIFKIGFAPRGWDFLLKALGKRGVSEEELMVAGLVSKKEGQKGFYDRFRDRIIFPIYDFGGNPIAFGGRLLPDSENKNDRAKYLNSPETSVFKKSRTMYGLNLAREKMRSNKKVIVVEGYFDVITLFQNGFDFSVATLGVAFTQDHLRLLRSHAEEFLFVFDPDEAGEAATERAGIVVGNSMNLSYVPKGLLSSQILGEDFVDKRGAGTVDIRVVALSDNLDVDEFLRTKGADELEKLLASSEGLLERTVRMTLDNVDTSSTKSKKIDAIEKILPLLAASHRSVQEQFFSLLEIRLGIPYPTLSSMLDRKIKNRNSSSKKSASITLVDAKKKPPKIEIDFLELLLHRPDLIDLKTIDMSFFSDSIVRTILIELRDVSEKGIRMSAASLLDHLDDEVARSLVIELSSSQLGDERDEEEALDCLSRLREIKLRREQEKFNQKIYNISREKGDNAEILWDLLEQKNKLLKEKQKDVSS
ncbi:MAG: DNA primase [Nitrospinota bacterium]|nr:DNA primase [Nitrospinota bacterium]